MAITSFLPLRIHALDQPLLGIDLAREPLTERGAIREIRWRLRRALRGGDIGLVAGGAGAGGLKLAQHIDRRTGRRQQSRRS